MRGQDKTGQKATATVLTGYSGIIDGLLRKDVTNSSVCLERLQEAGYTGGLTTVKTYITDHRDLIPPKRQLVAPQGNRGRRYQTAPGPISFYNKHPIAFQNSIQHPGYKARTLTIHMRLKLL